MPINVYLPISLRGKRAHTCQWALPNGPYVPMGQHFQWALPGLPPRPSGACADRASAAKPPVLGRAGAHLGSTPKPGPSVLQSMSFAKNHFSRGERAGGGGGVASGESGKTERKRRPPRWGECCLCPGAQPSGGGEGHLRAAPSLGSGSGPESTLSRGQSFTKNSSCSTHPGGCQSAPAQAQRDGLPAERPGSPHLLARCPSRSGVSARSWRCWRERWRTWSTAPRGASSAPRSGAAAAAAKSTLTSAGKAWDSEGYSSSST